MRGFTLTLAVEGECDEVIVRRLLDEEGVGVDYVHGRKGKADLDRNLFGYNQAARYAPWLVVRDLDGDAACAPGLRMTLLERPAIGMGLRIAVRGIESWLLADPETLAGFLRVSTARVPRNPDVVEDPKQVIVNLARQSRNRDLRREMVPAAGTTGSQGPGYTARIIEYARQAWRPRIAAENSDSLRRCVNRLREWIGRSPEGSSSDVRRGDG